MKIFLKIVLAFVLTVNLVHGLWSSKCKDAETSPDKVIRFIQNANCTLIEESRRFHENLNNFRDGMRNKMEIFKELFKKRMEPNGDEGLDYGIDVRMSTDDKGSRSINENLISRSKRNESNEIVDENEQNTEPSNNEVTEEFYEGYLTPKPLNILIAPKQCHPGQRFVSGRCRTLVIF